MSTSAQLRNFLHHTLFSKFKVKLTLQEFNDLLEQAERIAKISDQGLILIALTEQLQRQVTLNYVAIKRLIAQLQATQKKQRIKKSKNQDDSRPIQRRRKPKDVSNQGLDLDNLAHQSVSNPSNLQRGRQIATDQLNSGIMEDASNPNSQNQSKGSKDSKDSQKQVGYKERLHKISEQLQMPGDTYITNDNQNNIGLTIPDSETQTSNSHGFIANLNQKMKVFDGERRDQLTKTKKKSDRQNKGNATKKIGNLNVTFDEKLILEQTRISMNETFSLNQTKAKIGYENMNAIERYQNFAGGIQINCHIQTFLNMTSLQKITDFLVQKKQESSQVNNNIGHEFTNYQSYPPQYNDFTSQQTGHFGNSNVQEMNIQSQFDSLGLNINQKIGLSNLSIKLQKKKTDLFYEMLKLVQSGQINMQQDRPEQFSEIFLESIRRVQL